MSAQSVQHPVTARVVFLMAGQVPSEGNVSTRMTILPGEMLNPQTRTTMPLALQQEVASVCIDVSDSVNVRPLIFISEHENH